MERIKLRYYSMGFFGTIFAIVALSGTSLKADDSDVDYQLEPSTFGLGFGLAPYYGNYTNFGYYPQYYYPQAFYDGTNYGPNYDDNCHIYFNCP